MAPSRGLVRGVAAVGVIALTVLALADPAAAHSPHDEVLRLGADPRSPEAVYAIVRHILLVSADLGTHWQRLSAGLWRHRLHDVAVVPEPLRATSGIDLLVASDDGLHGRTTDGTWSPIEGGPQRGPVARVVAAGATVVATTRDGQAHRTHDLASFDVIADQVTALDAGPAGITLACGPGEVRRLSDDSLATTTDSPVTATIDLGDRTLAGGPWGLRDLGDHALLSDRSITAVRSAGDLVLATTWRHGVLVSTDGGRTFEPRAEGLTTDAQADEEGFRVAHFNDVMVVDRPDGGRRLFCAGFDGLFASDDDGRSWRELPGVLPRHLIGSLESGPDGLLMGTYGAGVVRRHQDGTFHQDNRGLRAKRLFAATEVGDGPTRRIVANHAQGGLVSDDGGRSWREVPLVDDTGRRVRARAQASQLVRTAAYQVLGRLPRPVLEHARGIYKRQRADKPADRRLPAFGAQITATTDGTVWLVSRTAGLYRLQGDSFVRTLARPEGGTIGLAARDGELAVLTDKGLLLGDGVSGWVAHDRPDPGGEDRIASWQGRYWLATGDGLTHTSDGATWTSVPVGDRHLLGAAVVQPVGPHLFVQLDDGSAWLTDDGSRFEPIAPAGTPIFRHAPSFPDLAPLVAAHPDGGYWVSDQFGLWHLADQRLRAVARPARYQADRPEIAYAGSWRVISDRRAGGGVVASSRAGTAVFRFVGTGVTVFGDASAGAVEACLDGERVGVRRDHTRSTVGHAVLEHHDLTDHEHLLSLRVSSGRLVLDAIEVIV